MNGAPTDVPDDPQLDAWLRGATKAAETDVDDRALSHLRQLAEGREDLIEGPLFDVLADVSTWVEHAVDARMREVPQLASTPRRSWRTVAVAAGLAAAAIALAIAVPSWRGEAIETNPSPPAEQAARVVDDAPAQEAADPRETAVPVEPIVPHGVETPMPEPSASAIAPAAPVRRAKPDLGARVLDLDTQAQARWRAGDLVGARTLFAEIVRIAGKSTHAQTAYGELFTLAHQQGDAAGERKLWRAYVRSFPRGRHADDARAGLCRTAAPEERTSCWTLYLRDFPRGTYREVAVRAIEGAEGEP